MKDLNDVDSVTAENTEKAEKKAGAKEYSLLGQVFAAVWICGWTAWKFAKAISSGAAVEVGDIIYSGIAIAACFSPVYVSILFDKIKAIRFGDK